VVISPGGSSALPGTSLSGTIEHDEIIDFEIRSPGGVLFFAAKLQNRVLRLADGKLAFLYQIRDSQSGLNGYVTEVATREFSDVVTNVDYSPTSTGTIGPNAAFRSADGSLVTFQFISPGLFSGDQSRFFYIATDAIDFETGGQTRVRINLGYSVVLPTVQPKIGACGSAGSGSCYVAHGMNGCSDAGCCQAVCETADGCCSVGWDDGCVALAVEHCACANPQAGLCSTPHSSPGCNVPSCCLRVCAEDISCCSAFWGPTCVALAAARCIRDCNGNGVEDSQDITAQTSQDINGNTVPDECDDPISLRETRLAQSIAALRQASRVPVELDFDGRLPISIRCDVPVSPDLPFSGVDRAFDFIGRVAGLMTFTHPEEELFLTRSRSDALGRDIFFGQHFDGIPVYGADLAVHFDAALSRVLATRGRYLLDPPTLGPPTVSREAAEAAAIVDLAIPTVQLVGESRLYYYNDGLFTGLEAPTHLAWRVSIHGATGRWRYFIDAHTAQVLMAQSLDELDAPDKDFDLNTAKSNDSRICWDSPFSPDSDEWYDEDGPCCDYPNCAEACPGGCSAPACNQLGCDADGDNMYCFVHQTYDYYFDTFHRHSFDGDEEEVEAYVHWVPDAGRGVTCPNAVTNTDYECLMFCNTVTSQDTVSHEFTHLVNASDDMAQLVYRDQPGALSESFSDVFASFVDRTDWTIAEDEPGGAGRDMSNPPLFCDPDHMSPLVSGDTAACGIIGGLRPPPAGRRNAANDWGSVHTNSGIPNKIAYLITAGDTFNGVTVTGIGYEKAEQIYYRTLQWLGSNAQFSDLRNGLILQARTLADSPDWPHTYADVCSVINACFAVGIGDPDSDCDGFEDSNDEDDDNDGIPDGRDNCRTVSNASQADLDGDCTPGDDQCGDPCDPDQDNDGQRDDGDSSGVRGDFPCPPGGNASCDDNCPRVPNASGLGTCIAGVVDTCTSDAACDTSSGANDGVCSNNQEDADGDGIGDACDDDDGDGVINPRDNCPSVPNGPTLGTCIVGIAGTCRSHQACDDTPGHGRCSLFQENSDVDGFGDACDDDMDNDGRLNANDNCPLTPNGANLGSCMEGRTGLCLSDRHCDTALNANDGLCSIAQEDRDGDGAGDVCDNCGRIDGCGLVFNPSQANFDCDRFAVRDGSVCDECGDACDDDRDGDGVSNATDNCPDRANGAWQQFLDLDNDGVGSICDPDERQILGGHSMPDPTNIFAGFPGSLADSLLIPIAPCLADGPGCPDYLSDRFRVSVEIGLPYSLMGARIVDDAGKAVARSKFGQTVRTMAFTPRADSVFRLPAVATAAAGVGMSSPAETRQYFLELWAAPGMAPNTSYPFLIAVANDDGVVNAADHGSFVACLSGPGGETAPKPELPCIRFDEDRDQDVDLADWAALQRDFSGPLP